MSAPDWTAFRCPERPLDPPEKRYPRGRQTLIIYIERDDDELEVECEMDEGSVWRSRIYGTKQEVELTADEKQRAEEDYAMSLHDAEDAAREDAYDRMRDER